MRLLVTIPHFCRRNPGLPGTLPGSPPAHGVYGSEDGDPEARSRSVARCITALHQTFGPRQALFDDGRSNCNAMFAATELHIAVLTAGDNHLVSALPPYFFTHYPVDIDPRHLGFACQRLMQTQAGRFDIYAYLEDDLGITDPLFFAKLAWFSRVFGDKALLQPNRFELADDLEVLKLYVDAATLHPERSREHQDVSVRPLLVAEMLGRAIRFQRVDNVHSGCFFLNAAQLARVAAIPEFGQSTEAFFGPLESAATMAVMRTFDVYKPARENAGFLELQHLARRFLIMAPGADAG